MSNTESVLFDRLLSQLREEFEHLRWHSSAVYAQLTHRASNAEAEGVVGTPIFSREPVGVRGAGHRDARQIFDERGNPAFRNDAVLDATGKPILNPAGLPFDVVMPATRYVTFAGQSEDFSRLLEAGARAGRLMAQSPVTPAMSALNGWRFSTPDELWWSLVFELAWSQQHPLVVAERRIWAPDKPNFLLPYDLTALQRLEASFLVTKVPNNWLTRLPDAWVSEIDNLVSASMDAIQLFQGEIAPQITSNHLGKEEATSFPPHEERRTMQLRRRFAVALSFPGERRNFVVAVADALRDAFGEARILYDKYHQVELARLNLDQHLQGLYSDSSDLIVVFVCAKYNEKEWCGLEWRAIREVIKARERSDEDILILRFDEAKLSGLQTFDGYIDIADMSSRQVADVILRRWTAMR